MSDRVKWIDYKGEKILYADLSNTKNGEEVEGILNSVLDIAEKVPEGTLKYLTNMEKAHVSTKSMPVYRESATQINPYIEKWSMFGLSKINVMILNLLQKTLGINAQPFTNETEAKDYLVK